MISLHLKTILFGWRLNGLSWWLFFAVYLVCERPMSLLGKLHRQQGTAGGGGALLNKEAGLWLVSGRTEEKEGRELREWLNGTARERGVGVGGGCLVGVRGERERQRDGSRWTAACNTLTKDRLYMWQCLCVCMRSRDAVCRIMVVNEWRCNSERLSCPLEFGAVSSNPLEEKRIQETEEWTLLLSALLLLSLIRCKTSKLL